MRLLFSLLTHFSASSSSFRECKDERQRHNKGNKNIRIFVVGCPITPKKPPHIIRTFHSFFLSQFLYIYKYFLFPSNYLSIFPSIFILISLFIHFNLLLVPQIVRDIYFMYVCASSILASFSPSFLYKSDAFFCCFYFYIFSKDSKLPFLIPILFI